MERKGDEGKREGERREMREGERKGDEGKREGERREMRGRGKERGGRWKAALTNDDQNSRTAGDKLWWVTRRYPH
ncbi:hypothetical protein Pmani_033193 [Petrolisthes manimaculis]|uniref:Uncharacterized protein n=1 Tax=Petrolisthes manimaculis TaxID=1843537 RepID=A0AAE1NQ49_9EUCA|nr:hypothetical protein Pmani_033193 [Petrolisthes manimaculis]